MNLFIDIGNTNTKIKFEIVTTIESNPDMTLEELVNEIGEFKMLGVTEVTHVVISSVVPKLTELFIKYSNQILNLEPLIVSNETSIYEIPYKEEVGADILSSINAVVGEAIIIMLGTATVISYVKDGLLVGVVISAGVKTSVKSLINNTALLEDFPLEVPKNVLGTNTLECLQSGAFYSQAAMIDGIIDRINPSNNVKLLALGGFSHKVIPLCNHKIEIDNDLIFKGLLNILNHSLDRN